MRRDRKRFFDLAEDPKNWNVQTRSYDWEVRDLVGHMIDVTEGYISRWEAAKKGEAPNALGLSVMSERLSDHALEFRKLSREEAIARLKKDAAKLDAIFEALTPEEWTGFFVTHPYMGPVPAGFYPVFDILDFGIHPYDIEYGLGNKLAELNEATAGILIPFCFILMQYTVDPERAAGIYTVYGIEISGPWGGKWRATVKDSRWSAEPEKDDFKGCEALFRHTPSDFVLTVLGRFPGGSATGDPEVIEQVRSLFFNLEPFGWQVSPVRSRVTDVAKGPTKVTVGFGPRDLPEPSEQLAQRISERASFADDKLDWEEQRAAVWTVALSERAHERGLFTSSPGYLFTAVGFVDFPTNDVPFGVVVFVQRPEVGAGFRLAGGVASPIDYLTVDDRPFPVYRREIRYVRQAPAVSVRGGTASCWAISRRYFDRIDPALLTAGHVAAQDRDQPSPPIGLEVPMDDGTIGTVVDVAPGGLDVALVKSDETATITRPLAIGAPRNWANVTFTSASHKVKTKIRMVLDLAGLPRSALIPERVMLAQAGVDGDSGSIVLDNRGRAVAMYLAEAMDDAELHQGIATSLTQIRELMDLEAFV
jgi:hypothetical protein